jgi:hypothetical protein
VRLAMVSSRKRALVIHIIAIPCSKSMGWISGPTPKPSPCKRIASCVRALRALRCVACVRACGRMVRPVR